MREEYILQHHSLYIYIYIDTHTHIYIYIHIYILYTHTHTHNTTQHKHTQKGMVCLSVEEDPLSKKAKHLFEIIVRTTPTKACDKRGGASG